MEKVWGWTRNGSGAVGSAGHRFVARLGPTVKASSSDAGMGVQFQLAGVSEASSLLVYQPETRTVYVYQGATTGSSNVQCSLQISDDAAR